MPQLFQVLKCYKCSVFQVHQTKKSNKWECKLCGEKQSNKRHYGLGTGKECRLHVQKLNGIRGDVEDLSNSDNETTELEVKHDLVTNTQNSDLTGSVNVSKWSHFTEETELVEEPEVKELHFGNAEVVLEISAKKRRKFNTPKVIQKSTTPEKTELSEKGEIEYQQNNTFCNSAIANAPKVNVTKSLPYEVSGTFISRTLVAENNSKEIREVKINLETNTASYEPPKLKKNSKWAQFADGSDDDEIAQSLTRENLNIPNNLYSLCDEKDIDDVLNF